MEFTSNSWNTASITQYLGLVFRHGSSNCKANHPAYRDHRSRYSAIYGDLAFSLFRTSTMQHGSLDWSLIFEQASMQSAI